jgi:AraC-like DNA-binding protein
LISTGKYDVQEVARLAGFHSPEYFNRVFKQAFGMSPSEHATQ